VGGSGKRGGVPVDTGKEGEDAALSIVYNDTYCHVVASCIIKDRHSAAAAAAADSASAPKCVAIL